MWNTFAQDPASQVSWVPLFIQLASAGGFGALVWYLIVYHMPAKDKEHREERKADQERWEQERGRWMEYLARRDSEWNEISKQFTECLIKVEAILLKDQRDSHNGI